MSWQSVELNNFRSYEAAKYKLHPKLSIVMGKNGSGKTNLLESLYIISTTRSWRAADRSLLKHGTDFYKISAHLPSLDAEIRYQNSAKILLVRGRRTKPQNYIGKLPTVLFEPGSLEIAYGPPEARRRFLNSVLANIDRHYLKTLVTYRRVLKQRNALLRSSHNGQVLVQEIFAWDIKLVELADYLVKQRRRLASFLQERLNSLYQAITNQPIELKITYRGSAETLDYAAGLLEALNQNLKRDCLLGATSVGPHREELLIEFKGRSLNAVASRGEMRTVTLALKLAELEFITKHNPTPPLLLLDDVLSELDAQRQAFLLTHISGLQAVITTTDIRGIKTALPKAHQLIKL